MMFMMFLTAIYNKSIATTIILRNYYQQSLPSNSNNNAIHQQHIHISPLSEGKYFLFKIIFLS